MGRSSWIIYMGTSAITKALARKSQEVKDSRRKHDESRGHSDDIL